jgi:hypothetical protein
VIALRFASRSKLLTAGAHVSLGVHRRGKAASSTHIREINFPLGVNLIFCLACELERWEQGPIKVALASV